MLTDASIFDLMWLLAKLVIAAGLLVALLWVGYWLLIGLVYVLIVVGALPAVIIKSIPKIPGALRGLSRKPFALWMLANVGFLCVMFYARSHHDRDLENMAMIYAVPHFIWLWWMGRSEAKRAPPESIPPKPPPSKGFILTMRVIGGVVLALAALVGFAIYDGNVRNAESRARAEAEWKRHTREPKEAGVRTAAQQAEMLKRYGVKPGEHFHRVQPGETIWDIATKHEVSASSLMDRNHFSANDVKAGLRVGQVVIVPPASSNAAPPNR
jgi:hypothetical protein